SYLPPELDGKQYYQPNERGLEIKLKAKLDYLTDLNNQSAHKRYK
ncbi:MAG: recombination factor protein RarA, partial [Paraglaciecola polaris]